MPAFKNGQAPLELFVNFDHGYDDFGYWEHLLPPGTYAKHLRLVEIGKAYKGRGRVLGPSAGYSCYRPLKFQVLYRQKLGKGAADPGTSSHGGTFWGKQSMAIDYHNWSSVFDSRADFYAAAGEAGFEPGVIEPRNGYPDEPWHVIDWDPWRAVPAGEATAFEEDDMFTDDDRATLTAVQVALGAGGLAPGGIKDADTLLTVVKQLRDSGALTPDQNNALMSVYKAVFTGGGDAGPESIIERLFSLPNGAGGTSVDYTALASQVATLVVQHIGSLNDQQVTAIAKAVADEQAKRLTS